MGPTLAAAPSHSGRIPEALLLYFVALALLGTLGIGAQKIMGLGPGLVLTELICIAAPALWFLRRRGVAARGAFALPRFTVLGRAGLAGMLGAFGAVGVGVLFRGLLGAPPVDAEPPTGVGLALALAGLWLLAPLCEELLFRAAIQPSLGAALGAREAAWWSAGLFALFHLSLDRLPETMLLGLLLSFTMARSGSYWACVLLHAVANVLGPPLFVAFSQAPAAASAAALLIGAPLAWMALPRPSAGALADAPPSGPPRGWRRALATTAGVGAALLATLWVFTGGESKSGGRKGGAPGSARQEWTLVPGGNFSVVETINLGKGGLPPAVFQQLHAGATLQSVTLDGEMLPYRSGVHGWTIEAPRAGDRLELGWLVPVVALDEEGGLRWIGLASTASVRSLEVRIRLPEGCGYRNPERPSEREWSAFQWNGEPKSTGFGRCGLSLAPDTP
ncbi:MAG: type II CAAX endopeptidase family protein [Candidatus Sumerlaeia bacterium]|nr:type II CAAX endopeptidase family protein [Candidatus Sumerlaeia bacterium]